MKKYLPLLSTLTLLSADPLPEVEPLFSSPQPQSLDWSVEPIKPYKAPWKAVSLALLYPGLGHLYLKDYQTAAGLSTSTGVLVGINQIDGKEKFAAGVTLQNLASYNIYAAYRDARIYNGQEGYYYGMPTDSLADLALAPFRWSVIKKPEVWGGLLGALATAVTIVTLTSDDAPQHHMSLSTEDSIFPLAAFPVAIGEESLFRGFLQSALYDSLSPAGSIIVSSLAFGAAHIPNAFLLEKEERKSYYSTAIPMITAFGGYFGYLTYKNQSLQESTAIHAWYDFILFAGAYAATAKLATGKPSIHVSFSF